MAFPETLLATDTLQTPAAQLEALLARSGARDRASIEKHLAACDAEGVPGHGDLWRRLAGRLGTWATLPVQTAGAQAVLFFVADGKYRMQVFAIEDRRDGLILLYLPDVIDQAIREKIIARSGDQYVLPTARKPSIAVHLMDASNTPDAPTHVKNMIGWNRKAMRVTLHAAEPNSPQVIAAEAMCALAAKKWAAAASKG